MLASPRKLGSKGTVSANLQSSQRKFIQSPGFVDENARNLWASHASINGNTRELTDPCLDVLGLGDHASSM